MSSHGPGRTLAIGVAALGALTTVSNLSMPVPDRRPSLVLTSVVAILFACHAAMYWLGVRTRFSVAAYVAAQAALVFAIGFAGTPVPVVLALYAALTVETIVIAGPRWGTMPITIGAIGLFGAGAALTWDLYRATTVALLLAVIGVLAHAFAVLFRREASKPAVETRTQASDEVADKPMVQPVDVDFDRRELSRLTAREREVLQALARGARTSEIAEQLDIAERTVKAHLASIYQKLGVESRTAAVAVALQRRLG
jgi:DNA-binding CsgD family transcriptional regulator